MGKHINTKVECLGCNYEFMTIKLKMEGEFYECPACEKTHVAVENEVDGGWIHSDAELN